MSNYYPYPKRDAIKNYFPLPKEIFLLDLSYGEIAVYAYLVFCEDRQTYQCWPSYRTIGQALKMSRNTVSKYVSLLEDKQLIFTEPTSVTTKDGRKRNGSLLYTIRPIEEASQYHREQEFFKAQEEENRLKIERQIEILEEKHLKAG